MELKNHQSDCDVIFLSSLIIHSHQTLSTQANQTSVKLPSNISLGNINVNITLDSNDQKDDPSRYDKRVSALVFSGSSEFLESSITIGQNSIPIILDTSSHHFLIAKKKCTGCTQFPPFYKKSPVGEFVQCDSQLCHLNGNTCEKPNKFTSPTCVLTTNIETAAIRAYLISDMVSVDNFKNIPVIISAIYRQTGDLPNKLTKPIFGVGPSCQGCPVSQLNSILTTLKRPYIFGVSLDRNYFGGISLGSINPLFYTHQLNYTTMVKQRASYSIQPYSMISEWNGHSLNISYTDFNMFTIETTLPLSYLPTAAFNKFTKFLSDYCQAKNAATTTSTTSTGTSPSNPTSTTTNGSTGGLPANNPKVPASTSSSPLSPSASTTTNNNNVKPSPSICSSLNVLFSNCLPSSMLSPDQFPTIDLHFPENFTLSLKPSNYFYTISRDNIVYQCIGIQETKDTHATFGLNLMRELYIVFDNDRSVIGFVI
ncbi:hypothetical protein DFA_03249 [Cavenderia fasciculata]|uniref:Peptidase A1 domain-containing protein n=1 Tax=Cavenderia fasciculata TaxID=261658 RepID=F4PH19_CACFS|nr:uncharacterized protein DFA_03249 [Cavenderia fasciculata]EGG25003.1 hypothetical protein DFA_03249 [Cavenderia fasciculata]|eukprot:XP_004362854.1 hypothetical protein DFA_03249 [Cavenderia fasciculata]